MFRWSCRAPPMSFSWLEALEVRSNSVGQLKTAQLQGLRRPWVLMCFHDVWWLNHIISYHIISYHIISGWWFGCHQFYFPINIGLLIIPIDGLIFFRGVAKNHQPDDVWWLSMEVWMIQHEKNVDVWWCFSWCFSWCLMIRNSLTWSRDSSLMDFPSGV